MSNALLFNRGQLLHRIPHQAGGRVFGLSVQPSSHNGDVFATGSIFDGVLSIFDIRHSTTGIGPSDAIRSILH